MDNLNPTPIEAEIKRDALLMVIIHGAILGLWYLMWIWIVPIVGELFNGLLGQFPTDLQFVLNTCEFLRSHSLVVVFSAAALLFLDRRYYSHLHRRYGVCKATRWSFGVSLILLAFTAANLWWVFSTCTRYLF